MNLTHTPADAYRLLHEGQKVLTRMAVNGMRVDRTALNAALADAGRRVAEIEDELRQDEVWKAWETRYGASAKLSSHKQLGVVLFEVMGLRSAREKTAGGFWKTDLEAVEDAAWRLPFGKLWVRSNKLTTAVKQLKAIRREIIDDLIHPNWHLNTVSTKRSSCSDPNVQNLCGRDAESGPLVRGLFLPPDGWMMWEADLRQAEVCAGIWYHGDPTLADYVADRRKDMHRDSAMQLYGIDDPDLVSGQIRHQGKNKFVFPQFYGDWYLRCAKSLWRPVERDELKLTDGTPLRKHLKRQGITELGDLNPKEAPRAGTFEARVRDVERRLWDKFGVYRQWKVDWWNKYLRRGWFPYFTGFTDEGVFEKNFVTNAPVQGVAFHYLLESAVRADAEFRRRNMETYAIAEIHDSLIGVSPPGEIQDALAVVDKIIRKDVKRAWDFVSTEMEAEFAVAPVDAPWSKKETWVQDGNGWGPKKKAA